MTVVARRISIITLILLANVLIYAPLVIPTYLSTDKQIYMYPSVCLDCAYLGSVGDDWDGYTH